MESIGGVVEGLTLSEDEMLELGELLSDLVDLAEVGAEIYPHTWERAYPVYERWAVRLAGPGAQVVMARRAREDKEGKQ